MVGTTSPWIIKSVKVALAANRLGVAVECPQEHCAGAVVGRAWTDQSSHTADPALEANYGPREGGCGGSPATHPPPHREPGWAAATGWQEACDLTARFLQDATAG